MIEQVGTEQGVEAATVAAANIIANTTKMMDVCSGDIETDDVRRTVTSLVGGRVKQAEQKLKTGTLKGVVHSFCTAVPLTKLCAMD